MLDTLNHELQELLSNANERHFKQDCVLFYKGQVPTACLFIKQGLAAELGHRNKKLQEFKDGSIVLLTELMEQKSLKRDLMIYAGSSVVILDKTSLLSKVLPK
jgi:hypothetical protein